MTIEIWLAYQSNFELFFGCTFFKLLYEEPIVSSAIFNYNVTL